MPKKPKRGKGSTNDQLRIHVDALHAVLGTLAARLGGDVYVSADEIDSVAGNPVEFKFEDDGCRITVRRMLVVPPSYN